MAQYKSGNKIKSQEEHDDEVLSLYASILFLIGAGVVIYGLNQIIPKDWAKEWRFLIIFPSAAGVGDVRTTMHACVLYRMFQSFRVSGRSVSHLII